MTLSNAVVLKREPLGSLREEFLIPERKFVPGRKNCGWRNLQCLLLVYLIHIKTAQRGVCRWVCLQCASTSCFLIIIVWACPFCPPLSQTRSRVRCWAANRLPHHPERSGRAVHGEVDGLDIGRQHGQRFDMLRHTHKPQKRPYSICVNRSENVWHQWGGG